MKKLSELSLADLRSKIKQRMGLLPEDATPSQRAAYDAYLNVFNWIDELPPSTSVNSLIEKWEDELTRPAHMDMVVQAIIKDFISDLSSISGQQEAQGEWISVEDGLGFAEWTARNLYTYVDRTKKWYEYRNDDNPLTGKELYQKYLKEKK